MIILASRSPRRRELFKLITKDFTVIESGFDESNVTEAKPEKLVEQLAKGKAQSVAAFYPNDLVIGCDTIVVSPKKKIFGIPKGEQEAAQMLRELSGKTHRVMTGVCIVYQGNTQLFHQTTKVRFFSMGEEDIAWYLSTKEPFDKAGAYGIQGYAGGFVRKINGDYNNVVGLPVATLRKVLQNYKESLNFGFSVEDVTQ